MQRKISIRLNKDDICEFDGQCLARVVALNHDDTVRRMFAVYLREPGYVAERIDDPDTIDVRYWGRCCKDTLSLYDFFGNEPLANYLYGCLKLAVPGLRSVDAF